MRCLLFLKFALLHWGNIVSGMIILLSPAKSLDLGQVNRLLPITFPIFISNANEIMKHLCTKSNKDLKALMKISDPLTETTSKWHNSWEISPIANTDEIMLGSQNSNYRQAGYLYDGPAFRALNFRELSPTHLLSANRKIRILSALYGLLKLSDVIQPSIGNGN